MTTQSFDLELIPGGVAPVIYASQYDKGQTWTFNIFSDGAPFSIPAGAAVTIEGTKPDMTGFQYNCTFSGSVVTAIETQQMTVLAGDVSAQIRITKDEDIIGTVNFKIRVETAALADDTVISETDLALIEQAMEILRRVPETLNTMEELQEEAEAWAKGTRNGQEVDPDDPAYHANAKWYAEHATGMGKLTDDQYTALQTLFS